MKLCCRIPLANFDLDIDASFDSRITAIFGPSGSGKTTLLDAVAGLRRIVDGEITIDGRTLFSSARRINLPPQQRGVGYVPQEGALVSASFGAKKYPIRRRARLSANPIPSRPTMC